MPNTHGEIMMKALDAYINMQILLALIKNVKPDNAHVLQPQLEATSKELREHMVKLFNRKD